VDLNCISVKIKLSNLECYFEMKKIVHFKSIASHFLIVLNYIGLLLIGKQNVSGKKLLLNYNMEKVYLILVFFSLLFFE